MPLHYHNQIVKDHTANSLLELAKTLRLAIQPNPVNGQFGFSQNYFLAIRLFLFSFLNAADLLVASAVLSVSGLYRTDAALQPTPKIFFVSTALHRRKLLRHKKIRITKNRNNIVLRKSL